MQLFLYLTFATSALAIWSVSGWDGLGCGDVPQNAKQIVWEEKDEIIEGCATLDPGPKAFSMLLETDIDQLEVWGYTLPGCRGARKRVETLCTNPDISFPYFASYELTLELVHEN